MEPQLIQDWAYLFKDQQSFVGKRKYERYLGLGDTIEIANDLELHSNFLLDEALASGIQKEISNNSHSTLQNQIQAATVTSAKASSISRSNPSNNDTIQYRFSHSNNQDPNVNKYAKSVSGSSKSVRILTDEDDERQVLSLTRKDSNSKKDRDSSNKEPYSFSSAKETFVEEGGMFKHRKEDYKNAKYTTTSNKKTSDDILPSELAMFDKALVEKIESEIIHHGQPVRFDDISGLEFAKQCVEEAVCWPISNPHLFQGLRAIPRGILLFGPPGTGKTLIGKAIANQSGATFFSISASSLMSKWIGEGEKTVKTLFAVAAYRQPSVVFIDEIDSLLCQRSADENEATRRIKTEFLVQLDGAGTDLGARVVIVGATNRPEELDEAVRRRFVKRLYIPLPDESSRKQLFDNLLRNVTHSLLADDLVELVSRTKGYSGADIQSLCTEAAMGPLRELARNCRGQMESISPSEVPPMTISHFQSALSTVQPSVSQGDLKRYLDWNTLYGSYRLPESL